MNGITSGVPADMTSIETSSVGGTGRRGGSARAQLRQVKGDGTAPSTGRRGARHYCTTRPWAEAGLATYLQIKRLDQFIIVVENKENFAMAAITAEISGRPTRRP